MWCLNSSKMAWSTTISIPISQRQNNIMQYGFCVVKYKCTSYFFMLKSIPWCLVVVVWQDCARPNTVNIVNGANIVNIVVIVEICGAGQVGHSDTCHPIVMTLWSLLFVAITTTTSHQHNHLPLDDNDIIPAPTPATQQLKGQLQTESSCNCYHSIVLFPALLSHQRQGRVVAMKTLRWLPGGKWATGQHQPAGGGRYNVMTL